MIQSEALRIVTYKCTAHKLLSLVKYVAVNPQVATVDMMVLSSLFIILLQFSM